jgi:exopolysaccharide production protein ExoZ
MPTTDQGGDRLVSIQVLRGIAALGVTCTHTVVYVVGRYQLPDVLPHFLIGNLGVDVFFVLSGFVMVYTSEAYFGRPRGPQGFFLRRVARIVPLYWATTSIILAYMILHYHDLTTVHFTPMLVLASYLFIPLPQTDGFMAPVHGVGWTLNYEMFFYACFSVAVLFPRRVGVGVLSLALLCFVWINAVFPLPLPFGYWADPIILEFVFGMMISLALREGVSIPKVGAVALVIVAIAAIGDLTRWSDLTRVIEWGFPAALIVGACALSTGSVSCSSPLCRAFSFLGDASYSLYLVHSIAIPLPRQLFPRLIDPATHPWLYAALLLCTAVAAASFVHVLFERPVTRILQRTVKSIIRCSPESRRTVSRDLHEGATVEARGDAE